MSDLAQICLCPTCHPSSLHSVSAERQRVFVALAAESLLDAFQAVLTEGLHPASRLGANSEKYPVQLLVQCRMHTLIPQTFCSRNRVECGAAGGARDCGTAATSFRSRSTGLSTRRSPGPCGPTRLHGGLDFTATAMGNRLVMVKTSRCMPGRKALSAGRTQ